MTIHFVITRKVVVSAVLLALLFIGGLQVQDVIQNSCGDVLPVHEPRSLVEREAAQLLAGAEIDYRMSLHQPPPLAAGPLTAPVSVVSVSGKTATLRVAKAMSVYNLMYAMRWLEVYREYHGSVPCAHLILEWDHHTHVQQCCRASL